jgi:hypothetical protein
MGTTEVAIDRATSALRLSPFDPLNYLPYNALAISYLHMGQFAEAYDVALGSSYYHTRHVMTDLQQIEAIPAKIDALAHSFDSSLQEQALGDIFLGQLLTFMWLRGKRDIEVLKSEVDRGGYDLVLEANGAIQHIQLKSSFRGSKVRAVDVSTKLLSKPSGCVLWLEFAPESLTIERFYWFGGRAQEALPPLGLRVSRHSKGNSQGEKTARPVHRVLNRGRFEAVVDIAGVVGKLFG